MSLIHTFLLNEGSLNENSNVLPKNAEIENETMLNSMQFESGWKKY